MISASKLLIVDTGDCEMLVGQSRAELDAPSIRTVTSIDEALTVLQRDHFDVVALTFRRRGDWPARDVRRMQERAPLARLVVLAGPWCEGPWRRPTDVLPGATIIPWHRWKSWLRSNAAQLRRGRVATWSLPIASTADESAEFWSREQVPQSRGLIAIHSASHDAAEGISDILSLAGYATSWHPPNVDSLVQGVDAFVVESNDWNAQLSERVTQLRAKHSSTPIVAIVNFPLPADARAAKIAGVTSIFGKPFTVSEFLGQLGESLAPLAKAGGEAAA